MHPVNFSLFSKTLLCVLRPLYLGRSEGAGGEDLIMARDARQKFPFSIECKNQEKLNVWDAYQQAVENSGDYEPILIMKKNGKKPLVVLDAENFIRTEL